MMSGVLFLAHRVFDSFMEKRGLRYLLFLASVIGSLYGYYYYRHQLASSPLYLWPFIPDCPLFTTLFAGILIIYDQTGWRSPKLDTFVLFGLVKYGLWTLFVIALFTEEYVSAGRGQLNAALFALHIGMVLLGFVLLPGIWRNRKRVGAGSLFWLFAFFLVCDIFDYGFGTHPVLPSDQVSGVALFSVLETILIWLVLRRYLRPGQASHPPNLSS